MYWLEDAVGKLDDVIKKLSDDVVALSARLEEAKNEVVAEVKSSSLDLKKSVEGLASLLSRVSRDLAEGAAQLSRTVAQLNASSEKLAELTERLTTASKGGEHYDVFDVACAYCGRTKFGVLLKPGTLHRVICPDCKRAMYVKVFDDLSIHTYTDEEVCPECHGTGHVTCPVCGGDGVIVIGSEEDEPTEIFRLTEPKLNYIIEGVISGCPRCGGSGSVEVRDVLYPEVVSIWHRESGKIKKGQGRVVCSRCGGRGFVEKAGRPQTTQRSGR